MTTEELRESLLMKPKNGCTLLTAEQRADMEAYCKRYTAFIDACKTEREATDWAVATCEAHGFKPLVWLPVLVTAFPLLWDLSGSPLTAKAS